jgi:hypothetical protein
MQCRQLARSRMASSAPGAAQRLHPPTCPFRQVCLGVRQGAGSLGRGHSSCARQAAAPPHGQPVLLQVLAACCAPPPCPAGPWACPPRPAPRPCRAAPARTPRACVSRRAPALIPCACVQEGPGEAQHTWPRTPEAPRAALMCTCRPLRRGQSSPPPSLAHSPAVQVGGGHGGEEELAAVGAGACIGHGQQAGRLVLQLEVLVLELGAVDGLAAGGGSSRWQQQVTLWCCCHCCCCRCCC